MSCEGIFIAETEIPPEIKINSIGTKLNLK